MRILTYKRTHTGDPDATGRFGVNHCMGRVRNFRYDAVIGVGGIGREPFSEGIAGRITWIGLGPRRIRLSSRSDTVVTFERFALWDQRGPLLIEEAPALADRILGRGVRILLNGYAAEEYAEAQSLIRRLLIDAPPSGGQTKRIAKVCRSRKRFAGRCC